jgi:hypothetical protein
MDEEYSIVYVDKPEESAWGIIGRGVGNYNEQQTGDNSFNAYVSFFTRLTKKL